MTQRFKSYALILLLATSSMRGNWSQGEIIGATVVGTVVGLLVVEHGIIPAITGSWERQRQEKLAQELAAQQARDRAYAQRVMAEAASLYASELNKVSHLTKQELVTIITGKYGNREHKFFTYDQELKAILEKLTQINVSALEPAEQESFFTLLTNLRALNQQKNILLEDEITRQIRQHRDLTQQQAKFNAELNTQQELQALTGEVRSVVHDHANNRSWMEGMFKETARAARTEGERTREQINNVVHTMHNKDQRDSNWQARQDDNWRRLNNELRDRERAAAQRPAPLFPAPVAPAPSAPDMPPPSYNPAWRPEN